MQLIQSYGEAVDGGYLIGYVGSSTITPKFDQGGYEDLENGNGEMTGPQIEDQIRPQNLMNLE